MEPPSYGCRRRHALTCAALMASGLELANATWLADRQMATGGHPPLDEHDAQEQLGPAWLSVARQYAAVVGHEEVQRIVCRVCEDEWNSDDEACRCGSEASLTTYGWRPLQPAARLRHPSWIVFLHGINTRGSWQEALSWRLSVMTPTAVPVHIRKYGPMRLAQFSRKRARAAAVALARDLHTTSEEAAEAGRHGAPDIIAHSMGTWLVGHALRLDTSLRLGRVILTGSILSPTFEWDELLAAGRVEAVLNHRAGCDFPVWIARYAIPDSGPSGRVGFTSDCVVDALEPKWGHSQYFSEQDDALFTSLTNLWRPFLTWDLSSITELRGPVPRANWRPRAGRIRTVQ